MAGYTDQQLLQVLQPRLFPGEQVWTAAYGETGMPVWGRLICMLLMIPGVVLGVVVFLVWSLLAMKNYVVALTSHRLMVIEVSGLTPKQNAWDYPLPLQGRATLYHVGRGFSRGYLLKIVAQRPFSLRFLNSSPTNLENAANLGQWLERGMQLPGR